MTDARDSEASQRVELLTRYTPGARILLARDQDDLRAVLAENREMRKQIAAASWEWAWRSKAADGPGEVIFPASSEKEAADNVLQRRLKLDSRRRYQVLRRLVGEWQPADEGGGA